MSILLRHVFASLGLGISLVLAASVSVAETAPPDPLAAKALFDQGRTLLDGGDWEGACRKFDESVALSPNVSTLIKVARCRVHEGKLATATEQYQRARALNQQKSDQPSGRRAELDATIESEVNELAPRIPRLRIVVLDPPPGLTVRRNGAPVALGETLGVDAGAYRISVEAPGFVPETRSVTIGERKPSDPVVEVTLRLTPAAAPASVAPPPSAAPVVPAPAPSVPAPASVPAQSEPLDGPRGGSTRQAGYIVGGVGVAALAAAGVLGILTLKRVHDGDPLCQKPGGTCDARGMELREQARQLQTAGFVVAGVGGAALGTGIVLVLSAKDHPPSAALAFGPTSVAGTLKW